jgi:fatty acid desaturase
MSSVINFTKAKVNADISVLSVSIKPTTIRRRELPPLPKELAAPSTTETAGFVVYCFFLFWGPGILSWMLYNSGISEFVKYPVILLLEFIAGWGLFALASATHEGFHFTLHKNKTVSGLIGVFVSSAVPGFFGTGFFVYHWNHHKFTNTQLDPDCVHFSKYKNLLSRLLLVRLSTNLRYGQYVLKMAFSSSKDFEYVSPLNRRQLKYFSVANLLTQAFWMSVYGALAYVSLTFFIFAIAIPTGFVMMLTGLTPYLEHADTEIEIGKNSRSRISNFFTILQIGTNFHNEHHMYPSVPCWRLTKIYKFLEKKNYYEANGIAVEQNFVSGFKYAGSNYSYTSGLDLL